MADFDNPLSLNVIGVSDLVGNPTNKTGTNNNSPEGADSELFDALDVSMTDEELLKLRDEYEKRYAPYESILIPRVNKIRYSYIGKNPQGVWLYDSDAPVGANLQFEAVETFLAAALAKNPEPVVYSDDTAEGDAIANAVKTMLAFHSDQLVIRRKLSMMVRQWSMDLLGVLKPGWNPRTNDVTIENRKIRDYVFDPDGYVNAYGDFSSWFGERIKVTAEKLAEEFPKHKQYIEHIVQGKMGTEVTYTEWWPTDEYCFYSFKEKILDKHKNQYFKYEEPQMDIMGQPQVDPTTGQPAISKPRNHFAYPKKPGIFLSVFSMQEHPHDITSLVEQNITNQNKITNRSNQIDFNVSASNNGYAYSEDNFTQETGKQASQARKKGNPILIPSGGPIDRAILALPAQALPEAIFKEVEITKDDLRTSWGIQGITAQPADEDQTARGMILNQSHDTSRIGGGIGSAVEQVADNVFNWLTQLYYVFYDEQHFASVMGNAKAVEYVTLTAQDMLMQLVVSVAPDSMIPKDSVTQMNLAQALFDKGAIGPKTLLKMVDFPDVEDAAADGVLYKIDPMAYFQMNFPEYAQRLQQQQQMNMQTQAQNAGMTAQATAQATAQGTANGTPPEAITEPPAEGTGTPPASSALSNVPLQ